mgnify:CR=1 FL=1
MGWSELTLLQLYGLNMEALEYFFVTDEGVCCYFDSKMEFCQNQWISQYTMEQLRTKLTFDEFVYKFATLMI